MADKLVPGDSLNVEVFNKFNGMADEVNALKESGGSGGGSVDIDPADFVTIEGEQTIRGNKSFNGHVYFNGNTDLKMIFAPQSDGSNVFTKGKDGQVLKTNGSTVYWGDDNAYSSSSGGGAIVELSGESGKLTDEQYLQCTNPTTVIKWKADAMSGTGYYKAWSFISHTYYYREIYISENECVSNIIEIDQISHGWKREQTTYDGGSDVSVTQTLTGGTKIGAITVDGKTTALYAPEGGGSGGGSVPADAIIDVDKLPAEENAYLFENGEKVEEYLMRTVVVHIVDTLPEVGKPLLTGSPSATMNVYYQKGDDEAYCYFTESVKPGYNYVGWSTLASGCAVLSITYGGIVTNESQATNSDTLYLVYHAEEYINTQAIYRVSTSELGVAMQGEYLPNGSDIEGMTINIFVFDTLPDISELTPSEFTYYLQLSDNEAYIYPAEEVGMMKFSDMMGDGFGGVVSSKDQAIDSTKLYFIYNNSVELYHYKDGWHEIDKTKTKTFLFNFANALADEDYEDVDGYRYLTIPSPYTEVVTDMFMYIKENYENITNIQYRRPSPDVNVAIICPATVNLKYSNQIEPAPSQVFVRGYTGGVESDEEFRIGLRDDCKLIYPSTNNAWMLILGLQFEIIVTTA